MLLDIEVCVCAAERAGAVCISGVNTDIFLGI